MSITITTKSNNNIRNEEYAEYGVNVNQTLQTFIKAILFIASDDILSKIERQSGITIDDIFDYEDNTDLIFAEYDFEDEKDETNLRNGIVKANTWIKVPRAFILAAYEVVNYGIMPTQKVIPYNPEISAYLNDKINELIEDERYTPSLVLRDRNRLSSLEKKNLNISVFIYSRSLDKFLNVSAFVQTCNISVANGGGNFQIVLPPIPAQYDDDGNLLDIFDPKTNTQVWTSFSDGRTDSMNYYAKNVMTKVGKPEDRGGDLRDVGIRSDSTIPTDFLSSESTGLKFADDKYFSPNKTQEVENSVLRNIAYFNVALASNDLVFIKFEELQIEAEEGKRSADLFDEITMSDVNNNFFDMIGLIDSVGESYNAASADLAINVSGRDLSKMLLEDGAYFFPATEGKEGEEGYQSNYFGNRDELERGKCSSFTRLLGEIQDISLFTNKTIDYPLTFILNKMSTVSVFPDSVFESIDADDPQFLQNWINSLEGLPSKKNVPDNEKDSRCGIWKLTNLIIDPSIKDKIMVDSSVATDSGSLMNFVTKICDGRFVEFFTDTYNDRFYWIVRKPPFTELAFLGNFRVVIEEENVLSTSLAIDDTEVYSWYRLIPQKAYFGDVNLAKFYFPAQFFPEFADVFGSKPLEVTSNYVDYASQLNDGFVNMFKNSIEELRFLIESTVHLPFTRKGSININGDRRIKKGMCVYLSSTDELFHVDSVSNSYNVSAGTTDRITTLQVSRGIVLRHAEKYFELVNYTEPTEAQVTDRKLGYTVNPTYFDFLLKKKQFKE